MAPRPGPGEEAVTSPPWARAMLRAMMSPMPEPVARRGCPGGPVEPLEHPLEVGGGQPDADIGDRDFGSRPGRAGLDDHGAFRGGGGQGVAHEVGQDLGDPVRVGPHRQRANRGHGQGHLAVGELGCHPSGRPAGQVGVGGVQVQSLFLGP